MRCYCDDAHRTKRDGLGRPTGVRDRETMVRQRRAKEND